MGLDDLTEREAALALGCVSAWTASHHQMLILAPGDDRLSHPDWPPDIDPPTREECRRLLARGIAAVDRTQAPSWALRPTEEAVTQFGDDEQRVRRTALDDPDQRLGVILEAIVASHRAAPGEPIRLFRMSSDDVIKHPGWTADPWMVREHDVFQLQELGLVGASSIDAGLQLWPTVRGREMIEQPAEFLERRSQELTAPAERSKLTELAQKFRVGDLAVGSAVNLFGQAIEVLRHLL